MHALGHNAGEGHDPSNSVIMASGGVIGNTVNKGKYWRGRDGSHITGRLDCISGFSDLFQLVLNTDYSNSMRSRFGNNAVDNYQRNANNPQIGPRNQDGNF